MSSTVESEKNVKRTVIKILFTLIAAIISSLALHVFVYPSNFVPLGLEAIVTMLQKITGINAGWFNIILNAPLIIYAFIRLNKNYIIYSMIFTVISSALIIFWAANRFFIRRRRYNSCDDTEKISICECRKDNKYYMSCNNRSFLFCLSRF